MPGDKTWAALESATARVAQDLSPQGLANLISAYAKLDRTIDVKAWAALEMAAGRVAQKVNPQGLET
jgi:hypothetical protein